MTKSQKADISINSSTALATSLAVIPIPVIDIVAISGVQVSLVVGLGVIYGKTINRHTAKGLLGVYVAGKVGEALASFVKLIPGIGTVAGGMAQMLIAGTITYSLGLAVKDVFEKDQELNKENLKKAADAVDKEKVKRKREELKKKMKKTKAAQKEIGFIAQPKEFKNEIRFLFTIANYRSANLRVTSENGVEIYKKKLNTKFKSTKWNTTDLKSGQYLTYLECSGLMPICIDIKKLG